MGGGVESSFERLDIADRLRCGLRGIWEQRSATMQESVFCELVAENYPVLFRIARHFTRADAEADQVVHRSLLELLPVCDEIDEAT